MQELEYYREVRNDVYQEMDSQKDTPHPMFYGSSYVFSDEMLGENRELEEHVDESEKQKATLDSITAVGDSIMLGASPAIKNILPQCIIDAKESRQVTSAKEIIENLDNQGNLGKIIIIALGTNGPFDEATGQDLIDYLGKDRTIYWVTVYGQHLQWQNDSNFIIHTLAEKNDNVHIIDYS